MKKRFFWILVMAFAVVSGLMITCSSHQGDGSSEDTVRKMLTVIPVEIPKNVAFAGEVVPLEKFYVQEQLDRELLVNAYWHSSTILMMKRANRWFPVIEPILEKKKIPSDFKYIGLVESGLMNVESPAGAAGFWQFMEGTAKEYGLVVNKEIDERYNLVKSTEAACHYFTDAFNKYGNWTMAAASFNSGINLMNRETAKQETMNYYDLYMNDETSRYIFRAIAIRDIMENPEKYGFFLAPEDLYKPLKTHEINIKTSIPDLVQFSKSNGISFRMLKELNPWLMETHLTVEPGRSYSITLPSE